MTKKTENFTLRMTPEMRFELEVIAYKEGRTLTNLITIWLSQKIKEYDKKK